MLLSILPETFILAPIWPFINSVAVLLIIGILALVLLLVSPNILAVAVHVTSSPLPNEMSTILPLNHAVAIYLVMFPFTIEPGAISP